MRVISFNCAPLWCTVMFLCIDQVFCQEVPCTQQLIAELSSMLEEKFALVDEKFALLDEKLDNIKDDLSQEMQELKSQVSLLEDNLNEALDNKTSVLHKDLESSFEIEVSTMNTTVNDGVLCPESEGFFIIQGTSQCLKVISEGRTLDDAVEYCTSLGLQLLGKPVDPPALQAYLLEKHGGDVYWVHGRGDGSVWRWSDGSVLHSEDPLWGRDRPYSVARTDCLGLASYDSDVKAATPYWDNGCSYTRHHICERVLG